MLNPFKVSRSGVLGINRRNVSYVNELNPRKLIRFVDDKTVTKDLANKAGIPTPEMYGVISNYYEMKRIGELVSHPDGVVIKPANGSQGNGIMVVAGPMRSGFQLASGKRVALDDLKFHVNNIISGMYSLSGQPDKAMLEYRVKFDDVFDAISFKGVPDIRVIVLKGIPIAAMLRLPTAQSDGKANLHKGGVGVGVNLVTGKTENGMQNGASIGAHPDTAQELQGVQVPHWDAILEMAVKAFKVTGLGYLGADVVLDKDRGPLLLELNARPGLAIQIASKRGLRPIMEEASTIDTEDMSVEALIARGKAFYQPQ